MTPIRRFLLALTIAATVLFLIWWMPLRWEVCQHLYGSRPAQIVCLTAH